MKKIDLAIIGAQKAGTTSLKQYLGEHPDISTHPHVEFSYFSDNEEYGNSWEETYLKYFSESEVTEKSKIIIKNAAMHFRENSIERIYKHNPNCHIVFILREPVQRAYSAFQMAQRSGWMEKPFSYVYEAIDKNKAGEYDVFYRFMIDLGIYHKQIETIYKYFPKKQLSVFLYDDLKNNPQKVCKSIFELLNISSNFTPDTDKKYNTGGVPRSKYLGNLINKLRHNDNPIKKIIRPLISERRAIFLSQKLTSINNSKKGQYPPLDKPISDYLKAYYKEYNYKCGELINRDLLKIWNV